MIFHRYLSSVVFQLQRFYPKTWLLWFQQRMDLEMLLPSISSLFHSKLGDVDKVITVLLALVLAYLVFILIAFTYIPLNTYLFSEYTTSHLSYYYITVLILLHLHHYSYIITRTSLNLRQLQHYILIKSHTPI